MSIFEFGNKALCAEEAWLTPTIVRVSVVNEMPGGIPQLTRMVLHRLFDPNGHDAQFAGVNLHLHDGGSLTVFLKLGVLLGDEPALKEMVANKGHAGSRPCPLCSNACLKSSQWIQFGDRFAKPITTTNLNGFVPNTDQSVRKMLQKLDEVHAAGVGSTQLAEKEGIYGFGYNPYSIITDQRLQVGLVSVLMFDWAHLYLCSGLADDEFGAFILISGNTARKIQTK